ncbi:MAG: DUF4139 domain-containing protein [Planctomycetota bacterium]|nr:DUF4139 domain-containing protein [Planctomycetota bacterium]
MSVATGASKKFIVGIFKLDAEVTNYTVPRVTREVFIRAKVKNTSEYPMLRGPARCYIEGALSCRTFLERISVGADAKFALGTEKRVKVERKTIKDQLDDRGRTMRREVHYRIVLTNNATSSMELTLKDLVPVSQEDDVKIKKLDFSVKPDEHNDQGIVTWNLKLKPGSKIEIDVSCCIGIRRKRFLYTDKLG